MYTYHIEAVIESTRFFCQPKSKADALREIRKLEKIGYTAIKLVIISNDLDNGE